MASDKESAKARDKVMAKARGMPKVGPKVRNNAMARTRCVANINGRAMASTNAMAKDTVKIKCKIWQWPELGPRPDKCQGQSQGRCKGKGKG